MRSKEVLFGVAVGVAVAAIGIDILKKARKRALKPKSFIVDAPYTLKFNPEPRLESLDRLLSRTRSLAKEVLDSGDSNEKIVSQLGEINDQLKKNSIRELERTNGQPISEETTNQSNIPENSLPSTPFSEEEIIARGPSKLQQTVRFIGRNRIQVAAAVIAAIGITAGVLTGGRIQGTAEASLNTGGDDVAASSRNPFNTALAFLDRLRPAPVDITPPNPPKTSPDYVYKVYETPLNVRESVKERLVRTYPDLLHVFLGNLDVLAVARGLETEELRARLLEGENVFSTDPLYHEAFQMLQQSNLEISQTVNHLTQLTAAIANYNNENRITSAGDIPAGRIVKSLTGQKFKEEGDKILKRE